ncbi:polysaccharide deacetylase [Gordoniibacillus kamchatkensis]|uniref:polysaccharide deacetylase n=1 Tax=Gordoniibacillus kamchatkensis TaxID=1590651 RepID=UPI0006964464|nr:polysaccharide deacetylase [Paenibacillus sp. VKM B-2647]
MLQLPYPSRRRGGTLVRLFALLFLIAALAGAAALPAYAAADEESGRLSDGDQAVFHALASGKKIMQPHDYTAPKSPTVYLTFDDGPSKLTPQVLDILQEEGVKATFFELGEQVREYPDIAKRVVREGHALGNHTYDHVYQSLYGSFAEFWRQVKETDDIFAGTVGFRPRLLRAPGGTATNFDAFYFYFLDQAGFTVFDWNVDSGDSKRANVPASEMIDTIKRGPFAHEVTVLMHDGTGHAQTVKALPDIIKLFKDKGYTFATLSEQVKPEQFAVTKTKWPRAMPPGKFAKLAADVHGFNPAWQDQAKPASQQVKPVSPPPANDVPLQLRFGRAHAVLPPGSYDLEEGTLYVPLRFLASRLGASVAWDDRTRTATVRAGLRELNYEPNTGTIRAEVAGKPSARIPFADMKLAAGSIFVPLRATLTMLGGAVGGYSMLRDDRYVDIRPGLGAYPAFFTSPLY